MVTSTWMEAGAPRRAGGAASYAAPSYAAPSSEELCSVLSEVVYDESA